MSARYRKKPVVVEAEQYTVDHWEDVALFLGGESQRNISWSMSERSWDLRIVTLEGTMHASPGDWIIKGIKGEFYPCKPDIFEATYEKVYL